VALALGEASQVTPAATRGEVALRVATYNVGAKTGQMFAGPSRAKFEQKLTADVQLISQHADVIGFQEVAPFWKTFIHSILFEWSAGSIPSDGLVAFVSPSCTVSSDAKAIYLYPGETRLQRRWFRALQA